MAVVSAARPAAAIVASVWARRLLALPDAIVVFAASLAISVWDRPDREATSAGPTGRRATEAAVAQRVRQRARP
ncbi:hypothetical protein [Streptomyces sp. NPDC050164]|uniref:hypothetical protein n=1 Tax=Streptomyces sp. NPDC050164 TaxID=3365605 RepID=UPI0037B020C5